MGECAELSQAGNAEDGKEWEEERLLGAQESVYVCVRNAPTAHINVDNFISIHVDNEQPEFW